METKRTKWINHGDDPKVAQAIFVYVGPENGLTQEVDVVSIEPQERKDTSRPPGERRKYYLMDVASYSIQDLRERFARKNSAEYKSLDWKRYEGKPFEEILPWLAVDLICYYGGQTEGYTDSNYWRLLAQEGIRRNNSGF